MGGPTFVNEKVVHKLKKNNVVLNFERKARKTITIGIYIDSYKYPIWDHWQKHHYLHSKMDKRSWHSPLKDGRPYFCQWKSGSQTRKKSVLLNFQAKVRQTITIGI